MLFGGNCAKTLSDKLQRLQNRAVRVHTHTSYDADANQLLKELGWDNLETRRQKLKASEMVYKSENGLALNYLSSKFIKRSDEVTSYNLRDSDGKLAIPLPRTVTKIASARMSVVSPTSRFAYKSICLHRGRFAYTTKSFRLHGLSRFAYIKVVSPTLISRNVL